jgi:hypothetical protein
MESVFMSYIPTGSYHGFLSPSNEILRYKELDKSTWQHSRLIFGRNEVRVLGHKHLMQDFNGFMCPFGKFWDKINYERSFFSPSGFQFHICNSNITYRHFQERRDQNMSC